MSILGFAFITYIQVVCMILGVVSIITLLHLTCGKPTPLGVGWIALHQS